MLAKPYFYIAIGACMVVYVGLYEFVQYSIAAMQ